MHKIQNMEGIDKYIVGKSKSGIPVISHEGILAIRDQNLSNNICMQPGGQENALMTEADIAIVGGNRGGGKTIVLLCAALEDIENPHFNALIVRKERDDLVDIINKSRWLYREFGEYRSAKDSMRWDLHMGGSVNFSFHSDNVNDFCDRFQGREYPYIGIDEITQIHYLKFKYLQTCNRNSKGIRCRMIGTCNPDPDSWVARFIDWWIGEDGFPIKERNGVLRYCFMNGDDPSDIIWGDTPEECYENARHIIDTILTKGENWRNYILSATFIRAELDDNKRLMETDPKYKAKLAGQSEEQRQRDLQGNWRFKSAGDDLIKWQHMEDFYANDPQMEDNVRRVSCDVAFTGGDNLVMWLWVGNHIQDVYACKLDSRQTIETVKSKLYEWEIREENLTYDLNGVGQSFRGFFPKAVPFDNNGAVDPKLKRIYRNLKAQAAYLFAQDILERKISINPDLLNRKFSGNGFANLTLREILLKERKAIRRDDSRADQYWSLIPKEMMKSIVGHSPDFIEAMLYRKIFDIKKRNNKPKGLGWL